MILLSLVKTSTPVPIGEYRELRFERIGAQSEDTERIFTPEAEIAQVVVGVKKNRPRLVWTYGPV